jgi:hypothetical protein
MVAVLIQGGIVVSPYAPEARASETWVTKQELGNQHYGGQWGSA